MVDVTQILGAIVTPRVMKHDKNNPLISYIYI